MKISFWIPAIVLFAVNMAFSKPVQVGTVLFTTTDLVRRCWTENDKSVLRARLIMQDLLPDPDCIDFSNPRAAVVLLDYFLACFEIINRFCYGKVQNLMYIALSDALGGYLRAYVLPYAKWGYYAGKIRYYEAEQLFNLYDNIRIFLKTSGEGWAEPLKLSRRNFHVSPLVITGGSFEACKQLRIIEKKGKLRRINPNYSCESPELNNFEITKNIKQNSSADSYASYQNCSDTFARKCRLKGDEEKKFRGKKKKINFRGGTRQFTPLGRDKLLKNFFQFSNNETENLSENFEIPEVKKNKCRCTGHQENSTSFSRRVIVPLPMLDDCQNPQSIAVPFKNQPFRNLHSVSSAFILEYYYMAVIKCFIAAGNTRTDLKNFNVEFYSWLVSQVLPHLNDDQWYPGFGGVLRIIETIKKFGVEPGLNEPSLHDTSYVFGKGVAFDVRAGKEGKGQPRKISEGTASNTKRHVITAILVVSLLWIFLFCACAFYSQATRGRCTLKNDFSKTSTQIKIKPKWLLKCKSPLSKCYSKSSVSKCKSKSLNFQFLVKFFKNKKVSEKTLCKGNEKKVCWYVKKIDTENLFEKQSHDDRHQDKTPTKKNMGLKPIEKSKKTVHDQDDLGFFRQEEFFKPILPNWPSPTCFVKNKINAVPVGVTKLSPCQEQLDKDTTLLWKKPSIKFKKIDEGQEDGKKSFRGKNSFTTSRATSVSYCTSPEGSIISARRRLACSCCTESRQPTSTSYTNRSSQSKVKNILSSTTMECFEDVKAKRQPFMKNVILASTEESECGDEASTSYESDY